MTMRGVSVALVLGWALTSCPSSVHTQASQQTFRAGVDLTTVDVLVVRDRDGQPITDLTADDFVVTVDGKRRVLTSVDRLTYGAEATAAPPATVAGGAPATPLVPVIAPPIQARRLPGRWFVLAIDTANTALGGGRSVAKAASAFLDKLSPDDYVGLVALPIGVAVEFTKDRVPIRTGLTKVVGSGANRAQTICDISLAEAYSFVTRTQPELWNAAKQRGCGETAGPRQMEMDAMSRVAAAKSAASMAVNSLIRLLDKLTGLDAPKQVLFVSEALVTGSRFSAMEGPDMAALAVAAQRARANLYIIHVDHAALDAVDVSQRFASHTPTEDMALLNDGLPEMAGATGAGYFRLMTTLAPAFDRIVRETSAGYLLAFQTADADRDGKAHQIAVRVNRPGVTIRARSQFVVPRRTDRLVVPAPPTVLPEPPRTAEQPAASSDTKPPAAVVTPVPPPVSSPSTPPVAVPSSTESAEGRAVGVNPVDALVSRARRYVVDYGAELSLVIGVERYRQWVRNSDTPQMASDTGDRPQTRETLAEFALIRVQDDWLGYRDVFQVDGKPVANRQDRLQRLFVQSPGTAVEMGRKIADESARYNVGGLRRNFNIPTMALFFLHPTNASRFQFELAATDLLDGVRVARVRYRETLEPTIIRTATGKNLPVSGTFWIEPATGRVLKTALEVTSEARVNTVPTAIDRYSAPPPLTDGRIETFSRVTTSYRVEERLGLLVPTEMVEEYQGVTAIRGSGVDRITRINCRATYSDFKRFETGGRVVIQK